MRAEAVVSGQAVRSRPAALEVDCESRAAAANGAAMDWIRSGARPRQCGASVRRRGRH
jgi:hypothetical protein